MENIQLLQRDNISQGEQIVELNDRMKNLFVGNDELRQEQTNLAETKKMEEDALDSMKDYLTKDNKKICDKIRMLNEEKKALMEEIDQTEKEQTKEMDDLIKEKDSRLDNLKSEYHSKETTFNSHHGLMRQKEELEGSLE